jgi:hypothetical protein
VNLSTCWPGANSCDFKLITLHGKAFCLQQGGEVNEDAEMRLYVNVYMFVQLSTETLELNKAQARRCNSMLQAALRSLRRFVTYLMQQNSEWSAQSSALVTGSAEPECSLLYHYTTS